MSSASRRRRRAIAALLGVAGLSTAATLASFSGATYSASSTSPNNTFGAAASFNACSAPGSTTVTADRDTYVDENAASSTTGGSASSLKVNAKSNRAAYALVGFTLPTKPSGCTVTSAMLKLTYSSAEATTLNISQITGSWSEGSTNWNNKPTAALSPVVTQLVTNTTQSTSTDVKALVNALYGSAAPNNGVLIADQAPSQNGNAITQQIVSREGTASQRPQLAVTFG